MREHRTLRLRRERLADLAPEDLRAAVGATRGTCETWFCPSNLVVCASLDDPCPSMPIRPCLSLDGHASCACVAAG